MSGRLALGGLAAALALAGAGAQAAIHQLSFTPADEATRRAAGPVTLVIDKTLFHSRVLALRSTVATATADLAPADSHDLGPLGREPGDASVGRETYRILAKADGPEFVEALCPGSKRAWLALTPPHYGADLQAIVVGDDPKGGPTRRCATLNFNFYGEWSAPPGAAPSFEPPAPPDFPG